MLKMDNASKDGTRAEMEFGTTELMLRGLQLAIIRHAESGLGIEGIIR